MPPLSGKQAISSTAKFGSTSKLSESEDSVDDR